MVNIPGLGAGIGQIASQPINPDPAQTPGGFNTGGLMRQVIEALLHGDTETAAQGIMQGRQADPEFDTTLQEALTDLHNTPESPIALSPSSPEPQEPQIASSPGEAPALMHSTPGGDAPSLVHANEGGEASLSRMSFPDVMAEADKIIGSLGGAADSRGDLESLVATEIAGRISDDPDGKNSKLLVQMAARRIGVGAEELQVIVDERIRSGRQGQSILDLAGEFQMSPEEIKSLKDNVEKEENLNRKKESDEASVDAWVEKAVEKKLYPETEEGLKAAATKARQVLGIAPTAEDGPSIEDGALPHFAGETESEQRAALEKFKKDMLATIDREFKEQEGVSSELMMLAVLQTISSFFGGTGNINPLLFNEIQRKGALDRRRAEARTGVQEEVSRRELEIGGSDERELQQIESRLRSLAQGGHPQAQQMLFALTLDPEGFLQKLRDKRAGKTPAK